MKFVSVLAGAGYMLVTCIFIGSWD